MKELYYAAWNGDLDEVKRLIRNGANIEERGGDWGKMFVCVWRWSDSLLRISAHRLSWFWCVVGATPLINASIRGYLSIVKHLVELKANIEAKDNSGMFSDSASAVLFSFVCICSHVFVDADVWC